MSLLTPVLVLATLAVWDWYTVRIWREAQIRAARQQVEGLGILAGLRPPEPENEEDLARWISWISAGGVRCTVVAADGRVLGDSVPGAGENMVGRPEVREAFELGQGRAVRRNLVTGAESIYHAIRIRPEKGGAMVVRLSLPLAPLKESIAAYRWKVWPPALAMLAFGIVVALRAFHTLTARIDRLRVFSLGLVSQDFQSLPVDLRKDELTELGKALNAGAAELKERIRTLAEDREQSAAILRSMTEGVAVVNSDQRLIFCNESFCRALGVDRETWAMRPIAEVIRESDFLQAIQGALAGSETIRSELVVGSVQPRSFAVTAAPVRSEGRTRTAVMVLHDITVLRRLERAQRDFVANISHEFRTPLTAIQGFAETLLDGALDDLENRDRFLRIISGNALRLGRLANDLLRLSQIESGRLDLEFRRVAVVDLVRSCIENAKVEADAKELVLDAEFPQEVPQVRGDLIALQDILQNLLDNAVRYTAPGGRIVVRAEPKDGVVVISVSDTGIGIPKASQGRIFERFYRVDAARSRELGGTGLGLSIAKELAELHQGWIEVDSEVGRGSTFFLHLPRYGS